MASPFLIVSKFLCYAFNFVEGFAVLSLGLLARRLTGLSLPPNVKAVNGFNVLNTMGGGHSDF